MKTKPIPIIYWTIKAINGTLKEGNCPTCPSVVNNLSSPNQCFNCGQLIDWENSIPRKSTQTSDEIIEFLKDRGQKYNLSPFNNFKYL